ncbi:MAG TPA: TetR/AcrR family transcriptional regulator [bacterium]|nr:TetR/AcrR family transcriptional regulator [bacterium]
MTRSKYCLKPVLGRPKDLEKRDAILKAAQSHFLKHGFEAANMDQIAAAAGVSKPTIYGHFGSKDELFKTVISAKCQQHEPAETFGDCVGLSPRDTLLKIARNFLDLIYSPEALAIHQVISTESERHPKIARLFFEAGPQRIKDAMTEYLNGLCRRGELKIAKVERAVDHFFSMLKGETHMKVTMNLRPRPTAVECQEHAEDCIEVFLKAYSPASKLISS